MEKKRRKRRKRNKKIVPKEVFLSPPEFTELLEIQRGLFTSVKDCLESLQFTTKKTEQILERTEDTVCNILLAIRQNQFLQAYYPEHELPGMYVTGQHPKSAVEEKYGLSKM